MGIREEVRKGQAAQAKVMSTRSSKVLPEVFIGDYVALPIPEVDRSAASAPNLICRIVDIDYSDNLFELDLQRVKLTLQVAKEWLDATALVSVQALRCSCFKSKLECNSRCHHNNSKCKNKNKN